MRRHDCIVTSVITLLISTAPALAGPCSQAIVRAQIEVDAKIAASPAGRRFAPESTAALLHRQPTPGSVAAAEGLLDQDSGRPIARAALAMAREADREGNSVVCGQALAAARQAIGAPRRE